MVLLVDYTIDIASIVITNQNWNIMDSIEAISNLEFWVKIASLGAAGVSTIFVGIIGVYIIRIPNDVSALKASLVKFFMGICAFMVIVCGLSSWANAYYTNDRVVESNERFVKLGEAYQAEVSRVQHEKRELDNNLRNMSTMLRASSATPQQVNAIRDSMLKASSQVTNLQMRPLEDIHKEIKTATSRKRRE